MITEKKLDIMETLLKEHIHYKGNRKAGYDGPCFDYVRNHDSIEVFNEDNDGAFYWVDLVCHTAKAFCASLYVAWHPFNGRLSAHIYF